MRKLHVDYMGETPSFAYFNEPSMNDLHRTAHTHTHNRPEWHFVSQKTREIPARN